MTMQEIDQRAADLRDQGMTRRAAGQQAYREALLATSAQHYAGLETETPARWGTDPSIGWN